MGIQRIAAFRFPGLGFVSECRVTGILVDSAADKGSEPNLGRKAEAIYITLLEQKSKVFVEFNCAFASFADVARLRLLRQMIT